MLSWKVKAKVAKVPMMSKQSNSCSSSHSELSEISFVSLGKMTPEVISNWRTSLNRASGMEEKLKDTLERLKETLPVVNKCLVEKQDEIDELTEQIRKIIGGGGQPRTPRSPINETNREVEEKDITAQNAKIIFPEEIWEMILDNLIDPNDLKNCFQTCTLFEKILLPARPKFLFPQVFPHLCRHLKNNLILNCRQVCHAWNVGVDAFLENHQSLRPFDDESFNPRNPDLAPPMKKDGRDKYIFSNDMFSTVRLSFLEKMKDHPRNPFLGRAVTIQIDDIHIAEDYRDHPHYRVVLANFLPPEESVGLSVRQQELRYWQGLFQFLERFGEHIWYLTFESLREKEKYSLEMVQFLSDKIFLHLPNIRRLRLRGFVGGSEAHRFPRPTCFPSAPKLETLEMDHIYPYKNTIGSLIDGLISQHYKQLKRLHVKWETWEYLSQFDLEWDSLTDLHIDEIQDDLDIKLIVHCRMPNLKKIALTPGRLSHHPYDFLSIMKIIIGLSATTNLHVLRLYNKFDDGGMISITQAAAAPAHLYAPPSLKTLEVEHVYKESDYTFLLRFPFLENLIIFYAAWRTYIREGEEMDYWELRQGETLDQNISWASEEDESKKAVNLHNYMFQKRMYECKIWEILPRLKVFTFQQDVYTREEYEKYVQQKLQTD